MKELQSLPADLVLGQLHTCSCSHAWSAQHSLILIQFQINKLKIYFLHFNVNKCVVSAFYLFFQMD